MTVSQDRRLQLLEAKRNLIDRPEPTIGIHIVDVVSGRAVPAEIFHWDGAVNGYVAEESEAGLPNG
jgi:hypothetical protein